MRKSNLTNRNDGDILPEVQRSAPGKGRRIVRLALLGLIMIPALGAQRCPFANEGSVGEILPCADLEMQIKPGTCVVYQNPCDVAGWSIPSSGRDSFKLVATEEQTALFNAEQVWLLNDYGRDETIRSICVGAEAPLHGAFPIRYSYVRDVNEFEEGTGQGTLNVTVVQPVTVSVTAMPSNIAVGE